MPDSLTLALPGKKVASAPYDPKLEGVLRVEVLRTQEIGDTSRGAGVPEDKLTGARDDDLVELELENGIHQWISVAQLREDLQTADRSALSSNEIRIPTSAPGQEASRDLKQGALKIVKILRLSPADAIAEKAGELTAKAAAIRIAQHYESKLEPGPGLYRVNDVFYPEALRDSKFQTDKAHLLFIHGTASSTTGSFASMALAAGQTDLSILRNSTKEWSELREHYSGRVLAFEHFTLSQSPVQNALDLARQLPENLRVHLVTHSRGGLVGELLCIEDLDPVYIGLLQQKNHEDAEALRELREVLKDKKLNIERFVRVACPARGTILASTRLDHYLSVLLNLIGYIPILHENPLYAYVKATILELIKLKAEPEHLPGLAAQMPDSPLVNLLNRRDLQTKADLAVIAGDIVGRDFLGKLKEFATNLFFWEDHDLVVNTAAMYGGMRRREKAHFYFDQGPDVNHFQYFLNHSTRDKVLSWLTKPEAELAQTGFAEFERGGLPSLEISKPRGDSTKPIVLLIGDFMASHLRDGKKLVWLDFDALMSGGVSDLHKLEPNGLISSAYQDLTKALESRFDVVQFPYKWSASLENEGARLAKILDEHLQSKRPVHIIAHGYGGLLLQPALEHVNEPKALGRIVCIATPFLGWDFANQLATGKALITRLLALMDITKTAEKIGALLLPSSAPRAN